MDASWLDIWCLGNDLCAIKINPYQAEPMSVEHRTINQLRGSIPYCDVRLVGEKGIASGLQNGLTPSRLFCFNRNYATGRHRYAYQ